jgi:Zn finger protein HypA/HybF involved in hydrogenase expression
VNVVVEGRWFLKFHFNSSSMKLECPVCGHSWDYGGDNTVYATCPDCKTSVKIIENKTGDN